MGKIRLEVQEHVEITKTARALFCYHFSRESGTHLHREREVAPKGLTIWATTPHNARWWAITWSSRWSLFWPENGPPIGRCYSWTCGFGGSFLVQEGSKRDILGETPGFPGVSRAHIPFGRISFWPDGHGQTDTDTGRTQKIESSYTIAPKISLFDHQSEFPKT